MPSKYKWICFPALIGGIGTTQAVDLFSIQFMVGQQSSSVGYASMVRHLGNHRCSSPALANLPWRRMETGDS